MEKLSELLDRRIAVTNNLIEKAEGLLGEINLPHCHYCGAQDNLTCKMGIKEWLCDECVFHFSD